MALLPPCAVCSSENTIASKNYTCENTCRWFRSLFCENPGDLTGSRVRDV